MLVSYGGVAASPFRLTRLLKRLRDVVPELTDVTARHVHLLDTRRDLSAEEHRVLESLLSYAAMGGDTQAQSASTYIYVLPRIGSISPWSSKATDILHNAGLDAVRRAERATEYAFATSLDGAQRDSIAALLHDRMTQSVLYELRHAERVFQQSAPAPLTRIALEDDPQAALRRADRDLGLALSDDEIAYLARHYTELGRDPSDVELMMFAQANSEHCRHKIFNARWDVDGVTQNSSLFDMIRESYRVSPGGVLSAYSDNAAVIEGYGGARFFAHADGEYRAVQEAIPLQIKVETHNHPTAISPFPGAATGAGGEIRDEGATGRGGKPKAGLCGFSVSNLHIPDFEQPWEVDNGKPDRIVSALDIMLEGPIGAAAFNNEFGRPNLLGYFRTLEMPDPHRPALLRGYHKPIMIAGGLGNMRPQHVHKQRFEPGASLLVLGGPAMLIGLGGGAASSMASGSSSEDLDYASVQRDNAEMQRRCQEVIERCTAMGDDNPIISLHDVGAGGLSNALPELINDAERGGRIQLREIPSAESRMSPMELWCNEAQERYVLAVDAERLDEFILLCERERCPVAMVGEATAQAQLRVEDGAHGDSPVDLPLAMLLGKPPLMHRQARRVVTEGRPLAMQNIALTDAVERVLRLPAVAAKDFLINIGDRTVGGQVCRDQMVGPWQVPVADCAVTVNDFQGYAGEAMAMGERSPAALLDAPASGRMAVGEALTNLFAADVATLGSIKLSANWMAACGDAAEDAALFDTVRAVGAELCPQLGIAIPVGKDSLSMKTVWQAEDQTREMRAPVSLIVSAFAPVADVRRTLTPHLQLHVPSCLLLVDLGAGRNRLGASALAQVFADIGDEPADVDDAGRLRALLDACRLLREREMLLAYHDRSDGGLFTTVCEMAFASRCGVDLEIPDLQDVLGFLFNEELGAVVQVPETAVDSALSIFRDVGLSGMTSVLGRPTREHNELRIHCAGEAIYTQSRAVLQSMWSEISYRLQALRDNADCAEQEFRAIADGEATGLYVRESFDRNEDISAPYIARGDRPRMAILREQGVNGHVEMAAAFDRAGFAAIDLHMSDIVAGRRTLDEFKGLVACGGFSYGDVLGAGGGWAKTILHNTRARDVFAAFFARTDSFALGVCNGCQMFAHLKSLIPGAHDWPDFLRNRSEQFEARLSMVRVETSPSVLLRDMEGSYLPVAIAHGEGQAHYPDGVAPERVALRYVDEHGLPTVRYPSNPNGSPQGIAGLSNTDGRVTIMMPHPERLFRSVQYSWHPQDWGEDGPWLRLFRNARVWVD